MSVFNTILGLNERNLRYVNLYNKPEFIRLANNKIASKQLLAQEGIPVPETYLVIKKRQQLEKESIWDNFGNSFVVKPNKGFGGNGVLVVYAKKKDASGVWIKANKEKITASDITNHCINILDGQYSLSQRKDFAFFEERIKMPPMFKIYAYRGLPDIRVIVFNKIPIMAELRLPTRESDGKANLHLGGIGVGIDMANGTTTHAVYRDQAISCIPKSRITLAGLKIPAWRKILQMAVHSQIVSHLGYAGVDIAIDKDKGPVVLEINARPGLAIQTANLTGLKERLERVKGLNIKTINQGVRIGQDLFGGEIEEEMEEISGKKIIGVLSAITILTRKIEREIPVKIDSGAYFSSISYDLAQELGLSEFSRTIKVRNSLGYEERKLIDVTFVLEGKTIDAQFSLSDRTNLRFPVIIGRRDLKGFLIDPKRIRMI